MYIILTFIIHSILLGQFPMDYGLNRSTNSETQIEEGVHHNSIRHIKQFNNKLFLATSSGLGYLDVSDISNSIYFNIDNSNLPIGGVPALKLYDSGSEAFIFTTGLTSTYEVADDKYHHRGTGISWSLDSGDSWNYSSQPVDDAEAGTYMEVDWYGYTFSKKVWHTTVDNVSYDISADLDNGYIYAPLWGCGLKRLDYTNVSSDWETIPLPMDDQDSLKCNEPFPSGYKYDPSTDGTGSYNHGVFSTLIDDDVIWVGTAGGINKGIINDNNCIDWYHYTDENGLASNWVVGIHKQNTNNLDRIWAITWTQPDAPHSLSYTDDNGNTWNRINQFEDLGLIVYSLFVDNEDRLLATTNEGLYVSEDDGDFWYKLFIGFDLNTGEQLLYDKLLSAIIINDDDIIVGSSDGLAITVDLGSNWDIIRSWEDANQLGDGVNFSMYPNPLYKNSKSSVFYSNGKSRFIFSNPNQYISKIDIYDFSMDHVIQLNNYSIIGPQTELIWDGKNKYGDIVANGAYFCRLSLNDNYHWTKVLVVN